MISDTNRVKAFYGRRFGLPADQIRFFDELTENQVEEARRLYSAHLIGVENYVYAVKRDGHLVWNRDLRQPLAERGC